MVLACGCWWHRGGVCGSRLALCARAVCRADVQALLGISSDGHVRAATPSPCAAPQHVHAHTVHGHSHTPVACHRTHRACVPNPFPVCGRALRLCASERAHGHNTPPAPARPTMHASTRRRGSVKWQCAACGESGGSCAGGDVVWPACVRWCVVAVHRRARLRARWWGR